MKLFSSEDDKNSFSANSESEKSTRFITKLTEMDTHSVLILI